MKYSYSGAFVLWCKYQQALSYFYTFIVAEGTFGVPLEVLVEKNGIESNLGAGPSQIRIPSFIDDSISAMKQMGKHSLLCP